jgi:hypothetical protein
MALLLWHIMKCNNNTETTRTSPGNAQYCCGNLSYVIIVLCASKGKITGKMTSDGLPHVWSLPSMQGKSLFVEPLVLVPQAFHVTIKRRE